MVKKHITVGSVLKWIVLLVTLVSVLLPFWMLFIASLRGRAVIFEYPPTLWPYDATLENYKSLLDSNHDFFAWLKNSVIVAVSGTLLSVLICMPAGYAFAKKKFPLKSVLYMLILATMMVPPAVTLFPTFLVVKSFGLINTLTGMFITTIASVFGMMLLKQHMEGIPDFILESARIDGAGEYRIFFGMVVPMSTSAIAILVIWCFMQHWNSLLWPLIIANSETIKTLPVGIAGMKSQSNIPWNLIMAATMLSFVPVLVVFLFFRRKFIEGMTAGAIKG